MYDWWRTLRRSLSWQSSYLPTDAAGLFENTNERAARAEAEGTPSVDAHSAVVRHAHISARGFDAGRPPGESFARRLPRSACKRIIEKPWTGAGCPSGRRSARPLTSFRAQATGGLCAGVSAWSSLCSVTHSSVKTCQLSLCPSRCRPGLLRCGQGLGGGLCRFWATAK